MKFIKDNRIGLVIRKQEGIFGRLDYIAACDDCDLEKGGSVELELTQGDKQMLDQFIRRMKPQAELNEGIER